ncbi:hypothetical protein P9261_14080, partial [Heyndrickxia coagulans]|nr:hypothetical protein [Heyndrickxia coagulans]
LSIFIRKYYIFSENYTEQVKHGSRKCTKRVSWNTRYLNLVEKNLTHTTDEYVLQEHVRNGTLKMMIYYEVVENIAIAKPIAQGDLE